MKLRFLVTLLLVLAAGVCASEKQVEYIVTEKEICEALLYVIWENGKFKGYRPEKESAVSYAQWLKRRDLSSLVDHRPKNRGPRGPVIYETTDIKKVDQ